MSHALLMSYTKQLEHLNDIAPFSAIRSLWRVVNTQDTRLGTVWRNTLYGFNEDARHLMCTIATGASFPLGRIAALPEIFVHVFASSGLPNMVSHRDYEYTTIQFNGQRHYGKW